MKITPVVLCGGSGTRLWPLSRKSFPKQFVPLVGNKSLFQLTLERLAGLTFNVNENNASNHLICVASEEHRFLVSDALDEAHLTFNATLNSSSALNAGGSTAARTVLLEPVGRNTAAAMTIAALAVKAEAGPQDLLLFCPADHHIPDTLAFVDSVQHGVIAASQGAIVTFGVVPTFPSTAYGYIEQGNIREDGSFAVKRFIEKPNASKAQELLLQSGVQWNAGIFLVSVSTLLQALEKHAPDILKSCETAMLESKQESGAPSQTGDFNAIALSFVRPEPAAFKACRSESFDYAVIEHFAEVAVVPFKGQWSDVGSWNAVADLIPADADGNRIEGKGMALYARNTFVHAPGRTVVALGTQDLLIVDTSDALLVVHRDHAEGVKELVSLLEKGQLTEAVTHRKVARPWGWYDIVDMGDRFQVKRIGVKPGASLSLQKHRHRAEHWIVVAGTAEVTRGTETFFMSENQSTYIPIGEVHRLKNPGKVYLEMIEVQSGGYLGEDDIVRLEDTYGRVS
jgi:mannose-1-phosphate guanylyltransferase/mannose-6-phosphate isomerase